MSSEQINRDMKAARIEEVLVEAGFRRLTSEAMTYAKDVGVTASAKTWHRVEAFLLDRFPGNERPVTHGGR